MTKERYYWLVHDSDADVSTDEYKEGWHWCLEFDGLLVGPGMPELRFCRCLPPQHPAYQTIPKEPPPTIECPPL